VAGGAAGVEQRRFEAETEAAGYLCCLAALADLTRPASVRLGLDDGLLVLMSPVRPPPSDVPSPA
jgi:hypothetical protein